MKKKFVGALLVLSLSTFSLTACGDKTEPSSTTTTTTAADTTTTTETTTEETTTAETETTTEETASNVTFGTWDGTVFSNSWLNMKFTFPEDITIGSADTVKQTMGASAEGMDINPGDNSGTLQGAADGIYDCLAIFADQGSSFQIFYANTDTAGTDITPETYLAALKTQFESFADLQYECKDVETVDIAGQTFYKLPMTVSAGTMNQDYYCFQKDNYLVNFVVSYFPDSTETINQVITSIAAVE